MKNCFLLLLGVILSSSLPCEARQAVRREAEPKKMYVNPSAVKITKHGIFLVEKNRLIHVHALFRDKRGLFVEKGMYPKWGPGQSLYSKWCPTDTCRAYFWYDAGDIDNDGYVECPRCRRWYKVR